MTNTRIEELMGSSMAVIKKAFAGWTLRKIKIEINRMFWQDSKVSSDALAEAIYKAIN